MKSANLSGYEYDTASRFAVAKEMRLARRHYAAGNHRAAAEACRYAFLLAQAIRHRETQVFATKMAGVVEDMEQINELLQEVKRGLTTNHGTD